MRALRLLLLPLSVAVALPGRAAPETSPRGGRVGWARLVSDDPEWQRHTRSDNNLSDYIKTRTSLNLDPVWHTADPALLADLATYPFIFSTGLATLRDDRRRKNIAEYLGRGGFLLVDSCINTGVTPDPDVFLADNTAFFQAVLPGCSVKPLPPSHEVYRCYFKPRDTPPHSYMESRFDPRWARHPLYGVFDSSERLCAILSLSGLQCGWDRMTAGDHTEQCMQMVVNVYVYAMTR